MNTTIYSSVLKYLNVPEHERAARLITLMVYRQRFGKDMKMTSMEKIELETIEFNFLHSEEPV